MRTLCIAFALVALSMILHSDASSQAIDPNFYIYPNLASFQFEPSIATHPYDPNIVLIAADARNNGLSRIGWHYSTNGGATWVGRDTLPTQSNFTIVMTDPAAAIDLEGNLFVSGIYGNTIFVTRSTNGGQDWVHKTVATSGWPERPHMTIDRDPDSPYKNSVYVAYTEIRDPNPGPVFFSRSSNSGQSFSPPVAISGTLNSKAALGVNLVVASDGSVYATWSGFNSTPFLSPQPFHLGFNMSTDGGASWNGAKSLRMITFNGTAHNVSFFNHPSMAIDGSQGERRGWVYIAYAERNPTAPDIFLIRSSDRGNTWSDPVKVNQDSASNRDQWLPWMSVDPSNGKVWVVYYDARNFPNNDSAQVYISRSEDGGLTFSDTLVSDVPFLPTSVQDAPPAAPKYMGSYIGISALRDTVWTAWNDNRSGFMLEGKRLHQVYVSRIPPLPAGSVRKGPGELPKGFELEQNYPNPFNPTTVISYQLPVAGYVRLAVYDLLGREVAVLVSEKRGPGSFEVNFDADGLATGVYLYRLTAGGFVQTRKMLVVR